MYVRIHDSNHRTNRRYSIACSALSMPTVLLEISMKRTSLGTEHGGGEGGSRGKKLHGMHGQLMMRAKEISKY